MEIRRVVKEILRTNPWLNGTAEIQDGDVFAGIEKYSQYINSDPVEFTDIEQLYSALRSYNGVFKYKNLLFFNDYHYGCFVYRIDDTDSYVEHYDMSMSLEKFKRSVRDLL